MPATGRRPFLSAEWRYLVVLNFAVDPATLDSLVPAGTVLDRWHDQTLVSIVGFRFTDTRLLGVAMAVPSPLRRGESAVLGAASAPERRGSAWRRVRARARATSGDRARGAIDLQRAVLGRLHAEHGARRTRRRARAYLLRVAHRREVGASCGDRRGNAGRSRAHVGSGLHHRALLGLHPTA